MAFTGAWSASATDSIIVPKNLNRDRLLIQMRSADPCSVAFGEAAVLAEGFQLTADRKSVV